MAKSIGDLSVGLLANTRGFYNDMKKARAEINAVNQSVTAGQRSMKLFYETQQRAASRGNQEQRVRDEMAKTIRAMREQASAANAAAEARRRLFGESQPAANPFGGITDGAKQATGAVGKLQAVMAKFMGGERLNSLGTAVGAHALDVAAIGLALAALPALKRASEAAVQYQSGEITGKQVKNQIINSLPFAEYTAPIGENVMEWAVGAQSQTYLDMKRQSRASASRRESTGQAQEMLAALQSKYGTSEDTLSSFNRARKAIIDGYIESSRMARDALQASQAAGNSGLVAQALQQARLAQKSRDEALRKVNVTEYRNAVENALNAAGVFIDETTASIKSSTTYRRVGQFFDQVKAAQNEQERIDQSLDSFFSAVKPSPKKAVRDGYEAYRSPELLMGAALDRRLSGGVSGSSKEDLERKALDKMSDTAEYSRRTAEALERSPKITVFGIQ